jgi:hypothetical protein
MLWFEELFAVDIPEFSENEQAASRIKAVLRAIEPFLNIWSFFSNGLSAHCAFSARLLIGSFPASHCRLLWLLSPSSLN